LGDEVLEVGAQQADVAADADAGELSRAGGGVDPAGLDREELRSLLAGQQRFVEGGTLWRGVGPHGLKSHPRGSKGGPSWFAASWSADIEADVAVELRRRPLHDRPLGMHFEGLGCGLVDLFPGVALAV
jgi:hypothetical protein